MEKRITVLDKGVNKEEIAVMACCPTGPTKA